MSGDRAVVYTAIITAVRVMQHYIMETMKLTTIIKSAHAQEAGLVIIIQISKNLTQTRRVRLNEGTLNRVNNDNNLNGRCNLEK